MLEAVYAAARDSHASRPRGVTQPSLEADVNVSACLCHRRTIGQTRVPVQSYEYSYEYLYSADRINYPQRVQLYRIFS